MPEVSPELLKAAFLDPIRFALLVDDEFPSYRSMVEKPEEGKRAQGSHVLQLIDLCRAQGWLCDVENDLQLIREAAPHLNQSDLAIVDFHLDPAKSEDSTAAIRFLQGLATSPHYNLAIVYTQVDVAEVALDVAFALGAGKLPPEKLLQKGSDLLDEIRGQDEDVTAERPVVRAVVAGRWSADAVEKLAERWAKVLGKPAMPAIWAQYVHYFGGRLSRDVLDARPADSAVEFDDTYDVPWVSADNLFVAFVNKRKDDPSVLVDRLCSALGAWNPSALKVLMVHARAALEKVGAQHDMGVLHSSLRQAGWLYNVFASAEDERSRRIGALYGNLFEGMAAQLQARVGDFGKALFESVSSDEALTAARTWSRLSEGGEDLVLHAANEFLSSAPCGEAGRLNTGLVFRSTLDKKETVTWVCTTPSCDLVPGQNERGWDAQMAPYKVVYAARLQPLGGADFDKSIQEANNGRHLYLTVDGKPMVFEVASAESRQARLEVLFVENEGLYAAREFKGFLVRPDGGAPGLKPATFEALAQLRPGYASKFLMDAGMQKARIGLSWAAAPPTAAAPVAAAEPETAEARVNGEAVESAAGEADAAKHELPAEEVEVLAELADYDPVSPDTDEAADA